MYVFVFFETLTWIWALVLMSDQIDEKYIIYKLKPKDTFHYVIFSIFWGYFTGLNALAGHELIH